MTSRRELFFAGGLSLASPRLIGTAFAGEKHLPGAVSVLKGNSKQVVIPTHEHCGDIEERLDFPAAWDVHVMNMAGHDAKPLSPAEIRERTRKPIGGRPLAELAAGRRSAVITFDDLTRPTPTAPVASAVVEELEQAGIAPENIFFLASFGCHRTMEQDEVARKLGPEMVRRHVWFNHNLFDGLAELGETSFKNRIYVNKLFLGAGLRITISGVKIHTIAGYGGGAKAVLPGIAGLKSIRYNHQVLGKGNRTAAEAKIFTNELRLDMVEAARMANVDFSLQIVYNNRRRPCGVFAGDVVEAHSAACRQANKLHRTATLRGADVVVANAYPQNSQATKAQAWIKESVREGGAGVLVMQHPQGMSSWHYLYQPGYAAKGDPLAVLSPRSSRPLDYQLIVYSQYLQKSQMSMFPPGAAFAATWEDTLRLLVARHKQDSRVAVYPYGGMQHGEVDLDG